jgi:putative DNA modification/repair radical SAM protein
VRLTLDFYRRNYIEGLFLSSGIIRSPDYTMEQLVRVARTLRVGHDFQGYIHLKTIPHADPALVAEAGRWADRLSINVELPTAESLAALAPEKDLGVIRGAMTTIRRGIDEHRGELVSLGRRVQGAAPFAPAGQSTQLIVGATDASDATILGTATALYQAHRLRRVYYSAFSPIPDSPSVLPSASPPLVREHRLYQADWLVRFYGFDAAELTTPQAPNLDLELDPKTAWALRHRELFPVDVNAAPRELLLRVPGMGAKSVDRLLAARRWRRMRVADLAALRVALRRALPFVTTADGAGASRVLDAPDLRARLLGRRTQLDLFGAPLGRPRARRADVREALLDVDAHGGAAAAWRAAARALLADAVPPDRVAWRVAGEAQASLGLPDAAAAGRAAGRGARAEGLPGAARARRLPPRPVALAPAVRPALAADARRAAPAGGAHRPRRAPAGRDGQGGRPRGAQAARVRALPRGGGRRRAALRGVVRAGARRARAGGAAVRAAVRVDALGGGHPVRVGALDGASLALGPGAPRPAATATTRPAATPRRSGGRTTRTCSTRRA